ncbi:hypothetical protein A2130_02940 [Candidatus Woesebacteria bacterium GWC2_33_12]|uniref:Uncharacterized protein n=1 Tax=Candidatus Woesebacteria bacterium GW2011_GWB1_33_22 TaxID=1618566 RepID=A0A0F9ZM24_9BACT|nr:MAG: hypothetical protein UR29_C0009G0022 [Candidatus Woesebacteria bacterium GW2011_GWC2_33_12]KKP42446.1 MAG: hypothetical protein UR33_C0002G0022 [Candidatus Woesebacteria bacterium GW2011_GWA2_33_20]KKP45189.1 MAG: hypothetical protein UR35_C0002G0022 [Candidatus Woesebacteria bacterium GW2011_GWB1_33_22]KKP46188.1 MAG: hypothetical protein UR37_C0011G0022 [Microgenomates group bacterium GW2011_GWC1_33_28]KKP50858.1 MAG: hypothetical protein UR41_C0002G0022 [Candidatus Woesebacteria bact
MQTLILPGYSAKNKVWVDETAKNLKFDGIIRPFYWAHWTDDTKKFDANEKANLIIKHLHGEKADIIAKDEGLEIANIIKSEIPDQIISIN